MILLRRNRACHNKRGRNHAAGMKAAAGGTADMAAPSAASEKRKISLLKRGLRAC